MLTRSRQKVIRSHITQMVDETGNQKSKETKLTLQYGPEPPFIKLYLHDICYFQDMPRSHSNVLYALFQRMTYAGNSTNDPTYKEPTDGCGMLVYLNSEMKKLIMKECNLSSMHSLNNILYNLKRGMLIDQVGRGTFRINPVLFGKGDWQDIAKLQTTITYDRMGRTFQTTITEGYHRRPIVRDPDNPGEYIMEEEYTNE